MHYTGIGSRSIVKNDFDKFVAIGQFLASRGHILRSGGADGSDKAFETGHVRINRNMQIFIPWKSFAKPLMQYHIYDIAYDVEKQAMEIARKIHPAWNRCSDGAKRLHTRNIYQVLGSDLKSPSDFLLCWTPDGTPTGGSRTAIILAQNNNIPVFNMNSAEYKNLNPTQFLLEVNKNISGKI